MDEKVELQGNLVEDFVVNETLKLSMWIPSDLGKNLVDCVFHF